MSSATASPIAPRPFVSVTGPSPTHHVTHPAKFSDPLIPIFIDYLQPKEAFRRVLDPFAGTGKIHVLRDHGYNTHGMEIEPEWAHMSPHTQVGDARNMPFMDEYFDAVVTSPTYGNRMADHHTPSPNDTSRRNTYRHALGRPLTSGNSGAMQWGDEYRTLHTIVASEIYRVLRPGGIFILNMKNHIRKGEVQRVVEWWDQMVQGLGFLTVDAQAVPLRGNRFGANGEKRVDDEWVLVYEVPE